VAITVSDKSDVTENVGSRPNPRSRVGRTIAVVIGAAVALASVGYSALNLADLVVHSEEVQTLHFAAVSRLDIHTPGSVRVIASPDLSNTTVVERLGNGIGRATSTSSVVDSVLTLRGGCPPVVSPQCSVSYEVRLPASTALTIDAENVNIFGTSARVQVNSSGGDIVVRGVSGPVELNSSAGSISGLVENPDVTANASAGSVNLAVALAPHTVNARIEATSSAGSVSIQVVDDGAPYRVMSPRTPSGRVSIGVMTDPHSSRIIKVDSSAGDVSVSYIPVVHAGAAS
jgi:hypothetical protein